MKMTSSDRRRAIRLSGTLVAAATVVLSGCTNEASPRSTPESLDRGGWRACAAVGNYRVKYPERRPRVSTALRVVRRAVNSESNTLQDEAEQMLLNATGPREDWRAAVRMFNESCRERGWIPFIIDFPRHRECYSHSPLLSLRVALQCRPGRDHGVAARRGYPA